MGDHELLQRARDADEHAFRKLVEPHQGALHAHCYRMLGSVYDAEDALQDAMLQAWRGLPRFDGRGSLRSWLYTEDDQAYENWPTHASDQRRLAGTFARFGLPDRLS
jgi:RNA polymerase sigma factor (sigma-70 family)